VFLGTPAIAVPTLDGLHASGFDIAIVVTREDRRRGRGSEKSSTPVKLAAARLGIPVTHDLSDIQANDLDAGVLVAYGRIIPVELLQSVPMINLHFSLLPRWRGAAPIERAILAGDKQVGVSLMAVETSLDTGPIYARAEIKVGNRTADQLRSHLAELGSQLLVSTLERGLRNPELQVGEPTYANKIDSLDLRLDWKKSADEEFRVVRVGGAWTTFRGARIKVWKAEVCHGFSDCSPGTLAGTDVVTGQGFLRLLEVQPENRQRMSAKAWLEGARLEPGERLE